MRHLAAALVFALAAACGGDDGDGACQGVGRSCSAARPCPGLLDCYSPDGDGEGVCSSPRPGCGGFAGTLCTTGLFCATLTGTDIGMCVTEAERVCICATSPAAIAGCE